MTDRIVIAGGSGFIGRYLADAFRAEGAQVLLIGRAPTAGSKTAPDAAWGDTAAIVAVLDGADLLINLAGKSVDCRYSPANRAEILRSRISTTHELSQAISLCNTPPPLWVNSSTATIYRHSEDRGMTESSGELGTGFSVDVGRAWEAAFFADELPSTRRVALRMSIVLGEGSALTPLTRLVRAGLGGAHHDGRWFSSAARSAAGTLHEFAPGSSGGRQRFSWIHLADVLAIIRFLRSSDLCGAVNVSSPNPLDDRTLMELLRKALNRRFGLPTPRWMLELGAIVIRTESELVLKSRWVLPERLVDAGYVFEYPALEPAIAQILAARS